MQLSGTRAYSHEEVQALMCAQWAAGSELSLDFSGEYVPVCLHEEASLASRLVVAYHNSCVAANIEVRPVPGGRERITANVGRLSIYERGGRRNVRS